MSVFLQPVSQNPDPFYDEFITVIFGICGFKEKKTEGLGRVLLRIGLWRGLHLFAHIPSAVTQSYKPPPNCKEVCKCNVILLCAGKTEQESEPTALSL